MAIRRDSVSESITREAKSRGTRSRYTLRYALTEIHTCTRRARKYMHAFVLTNEIVVLSRLKFESAGLWRERPERYGDVHQLVRLVAIRYDSRIGISDSAHIVFLLGHLKQRDVLR